MKDSFHPKNHSLATKIPKVKVFLLSFNFIPILILIIDILLLLFYFFTQIHVMPKMSPLLVS